MAGRTFLINAGSIGIPMPETVKGTQGPHRPGGYPPAKYTNAYGSTPTKSAPAKHSKPVRDARSSGPCYTLVHNGVKWR